MQDALRLAGGAGGVEDEERVLAVERLGGAIGGCVRDEVVPPHVAAGLHLHRGVAAVEDDALLDRRRLGQRLIDVRLERHDLAAPPAAVGGDDELATSRRCSGRRRRPPRSRRRRPSASRRCGRRRAWRSPPPAPSACRS